MRLTALEESVTITRTCCIGAMSNGWDFSAMRQDAKRQSGTSVERASIAVRKLIRYGGMTQRAVGDLLGITQAETARIFYGQVAPRLALLQRLEAAAEAARLKLLAEAAADEPLQPIQFYSCFVSYSTSDEEFASKLVDDLEMSGVSCWFAPHSVKAGQKLHAQIDEAIRVYNRLLLILSEASMRSEWVTTEIASARKKEANEGRQILFPIRLVPFSALSSWKCFDADRGKDSAREIREYFIPDFSKWKDAKAYHKAFERLLQDLGTGNST